MRSIFFTLSMLVSFAAAAQNDNISYHQDPKINELMGIYKMYNQKNDFLDGYRVQIAFSNDRQEIYNSKAKVYQDFPDERAYVAYEQPYYKLRLGDYTSRLEAYEKLNEVIKKYPAAFVVRDKIKEK
ncbi:MAG: SPOR domain-containing protein [Bacteroidetes bacterium]|nr:SPOR domain-containing protein [Bacteroidota bacterium]MBS1685689.1 SPOR domain-containing protein [Bacteroidota bacterium]